MSNNPVVQVPQDVEPINGYTDEVDRILTEAINNGPSEFELQLRKECLEWWRGYHVIRSTKRKKQNGKR